MTAKKTAAKAPSRAGVREEEAADLNHQLLSEKVRGAKLANDTKQAEHLREHDDQGDTHFNRRRDAGTREAESKATGARHKAAHEGQMARHAENSAASAHHAQLQLHAHQKVMHQHLEEAAAQKHELAQHAERRAEQSHQMTMALAAQRAHAQAHAHRRSVLTSAAHALFGGAGGAAKTAMRGQLGGH